MKQKTTRSQFTILQNTRAEKGHWYTAKFSMNLKDTLNLPDPDFSIPMKADLPQREPAMQRAWDEQRIYHVIQEIRRDAPTFVLHDGPPYTNSPIHLGTSLNKLLKDFVVRSQTISGKRAPYVPGFDNHGLPIEQAVLKKFADKKIKPDLMELRRACREHAEHYIGVQTTQFKRLGIFGLWEKPYTSMGFAYEAEIVRVFKRLVEGGYIYRGLRPVLWSPTSRTALADTEIVYENHVSQAIYVAFPLLNDPDGVFQDYENVHAVIWTTTPWTIPANLALAFHPEFKYDLVLAGRKSYLILHELVEKTMQKAGLEVDRVAHSFRGSQLEGIKFKHPIFDRESVAVLAEYVTTEDGTGIVHTAPGHGREDFMTGQKYKLPVLCPVDEKGVLTAEAGEFEGVYYTDCDRVVVDRLKEVGALLSVEPYHHQYPHAERDGKPVIFRATEQWFISVEHDGLRELMLHEIGEAAWYPESGEKRIRAMISGRPDWCVSRQRPWGVGIPIFYGAESGIPVVDPVAIEAVAELVEREGSDAWCITDPKDILPAGYVHPETGETEFTKETDVFDVWFDSACTHTCVLEGKVESEWKEELPADLFLEGSDQHRGWFNVSLIVGTAIRGKAPYRQVVTHGMVIDEKGQKMSKRLGNSIDPEKVCEQMGADVLRWWAASIDYENDMPCSDALLKTAGDAYRRVRNTLRYLVSNLSDFDIADQPAEREDLDVWIVAKAKSLAVQVMDAYMGYRFNQALQLMQNFCVNELSAVYADAIKDRMYCEAASDPKRRSAQAASLEVAKILTVLISPILVHTSEEVYARLPMENRLPTVHAEVVSIAGPTEEEAEIMHKMDAALEIRSRAFSELERWRSESGIKDSQDAEIEFVGTEAEVETLNWLGEDLPNLFKVAQVAASVGGPSLNFRASDFDKCERSRLRRADVQQVMWQGEMVKLTARDRRVLGV